ncbi:hypothetical protein Pla163_06130 [Planctomycetes bacterium Pla163]|uniref:DUF669 domain-containing protein n=2 Tax=Rohdeia mirabilis TaxID=2528008 RepID=A0A518CWD3_9BACT|nr:hypothetical protein Pla163_06130 [Planctomycetes bacterium Pla163]
MPGASDTETPERGRSASEMEIDFSQVDETENYVSVPEGVYPCRIADVREGFTRDGDKRWSVRLEVTDGECAGRTAAWDGISWSERGLQRAKFVLSKLGFDTAGKLAVEARDLLGRTTWVKVLEEERVDPLTGTRSRRMRVPFLGYGEHRASLAGD